MKFFKDAHVKFQAERISVYMLRNLEITIDGLQLSSASRSEVMKQLEITMVSKSDVKFYPEGRLGLGGAGARQGSLDHYSCIGANYHKSCVDQENYWVNNFRSDLNLFDLIKL